MVNYPLPSTVNVANFISVRPWLKDEERSTRHSIWKEQMLCLLESQGLLGFIDGQIPPPSRPEESPEAQRLWRRTDRLIKGWILGSVGDDALVQVVRLDSSREVWRKLEDIFNQIQDVNNQIQTLQVSAPSPNGRVELEPNHDHQQNDGVGENYTKYLPLRRAITKSDWTEARRLLDGDGEASTAIISEIYETALLVAVTTGTKSNDFVKRLLESMPDNVLEIQNSYGNTALHRVAMIGNRETADMLLTRNPKLLYILNNQNNLPVHIAAIYSHKRMLVFLIDMHKKHDQYRPTDGQISICEKHIYKSAFVGQFGASLLSGVIISQFIDVALYLVQNYPVLATSKNQFGTDALFELARSSSVFKSGAKFSWWQKWIYSRIVLTSATDGIENLLSKDKATKFSWLQIIYSIPFVKRIKDKKLKHQQALELVQGMCKELESLLSSDASIIYGRALFLAARNNIYEVMEVILEMFPTAINTIDTKTEVTIFHVAARERSENVFNLLYQMKEGKHFLYDCTDSSGNNYMHMCGEQAPAHKLNLVSGAALQMQRELQWFKEMEKFVTPSHRTMQNNEGKTPQMLFTEKHQELKSQGEKWMKDTATSCTIAAALIATVVFAAAFTVPGGVNNSSGIPIFVKKTLFITFAISDSVSLFSSATSLLMFLSILTSRYAEEDFLYVLPTRLCFGLLTLFTSITFMMVAFSITIYITVRDKSDLFLIPVAILACAPVATFVFLQFPLLIDAVYSTYGPGIFGKKH